MLLKWRTSRLLKKKKCFFETLIFEHISIFLLITEPLTTKERFNNSLPFPRERQEQHVVLWTTLPLNTSPRTGHLHCGGRDRIKLGRNKCGERGTGNQSPTGSPGKWGSFPFPQQSLGIHTLWRLETLALSWSFSVHLHLTLKAGHWTRCFKADVCTPLIPALGKQR